MITRTVIITAPAHRLSEAMAEHAAPLPGEEVARVILSDTRAVVDFRTKGSQA